jgi:hypothetical protein
METHSNPQECLELPDFKSIHLVRPKSKKANKRFGGLSVFVKSYLKGGMQFLKHQTNDYIWLQLRKKKFGFKQYICICYMLSPPADSPYIRALDLGYVDVLEKEIIDFSRQGQIILVILVALNVLI